MFSKFEESHQYLPLSLHIVKKMKGITMQTLPTPKRLIELEALRGFAAVYVFLGHAHAFGSSSFAIALRFGQEAVMLFFVLSGFVIYYATLRIGTRVSFQSYFWLRFRRIYPLFFLAMIAAYCARSFADGAWFSVNWTDFLGNLGMLQDNANLKRGVWVNTFASNHALWSLSYEWWFYLLFFALISLFSSAVQQQILAFSLTCVAVLAYQIYPNEPCLIVGYFYIWWSGVELAREYCVAGDVTWRGQSINLVLLVIVAIIWFIPVLISYRARREMGLGTDPFLQLRHAAVAPVLFCAGLAWYKIGLIGFRYSLGWFAAIAPISYAIYIFHIPVVIVIDAACTMFYPVVRLVLTILVLIPLAYFCEVMLQRRINRLCVPLLYRPTKVETFSMTNESVDRVNASLL